MSNDKQITSKEVPAISDTVKRRIELMVNIAYAAMICAIIFLAYRYALRLVMPFIIAFVIVSMLNPLIRKLKRVMKTEHGVVSFLVMLIVYVLVGFGLFMLIMNLTFRLRDGFVHLAAFYEASLSPAMMQAWENLSALSADIPELQEGIVTLQDAITGASQTLVTSLSQWGAGAVTSFTTGLADFLVSFIFTIMLSFFISIRYDEVVSFIKAQCPDKIKRNITETKEIFRTAVLRYMVAVLKIQIITFIILAVGMLILGVENALLIAVGIAIMDALPVIGTGTVLIPWTIIELIRGNFPLALGLIILYLIITITRNIVEPKIVGDNLGLNPIVALMAIYLGLRLFGIFGMIMMPIVTQIILELHRRGKFKLFREAKSEKPEAPAAEP